jgi:hypothetical protein
MLLMTMFNTILSLTIRYWRIYQIVLLLLVLRKACSDDELDYHHIKERIHITYVYYTTFYCLDIFLTI